MHEVRLWSVPVSSLFTKSFGHNLGISLYVLTHPKDNTDFVKANNEFFTLGIPKIDESLAKKLQEIEGVWGRVS